MDRVTALCNALKALLGIKVIAVETTGNFVKYHKTCYLGFISAICRGGTNCTDDRSQECGCSIFSGPQQESRGIHGNVEITNTTKSDYSNELENLLSWLLQVSDSSIDTAPILQAALQFDAPNDLRYAVTALLQTQSVKDLFNKDVLEYRRTCLIQQKSPFEVSLTFRSGLQCTVSAGSSYGQVGGSHPYVAKSCLNQYVSYLFSSSWYLLGASICIHKLAYSQ